MLTVGMVSMDYTLPSIQSITRDARTKMIPRGQILQYEGDYVRDVYAIKKGAVKLYDIDEQGNEKILHIVKQPALVPMAFYSGKGVLTKWFYETLTDCEVYIIDSHKLRAMMLQDAALTESMLQNFSFEVHELLVRLSSLGKTNICHKLRSILKFLLVQHSTPRPYNWHRVDFPVNHQLLADMAGVTRESMAIAMKEMQDNGVIRNPRLTTLEINKRKLLETADKEVAAV